MPRNVTRAATKQQQVQRTEGATVGRQVNARISTGGETPNEAFALADLIVAGGSVYEAVEKPRQQEQAQIDFETGQVDEPNGGYYYRQKVDSLKARAWWASDEQMILEKFKDVDQDNVSAEELNAWLDNEYAVLYGGMEENPIMTSELLPGMKALRKKLHEETFLRQSELEVAENSANIMAIHEANYRNGSFDYNSLNADLKGTFRNAELNEQMFKVLSDLAVRQKDPNILRNMPDFWDDGKGGKIPSIKHITSFNERMLNAELRAQAAKDGEETAEQKAKDDAQEAAINLYLNDALTLVTEGREAQAHVLLQDLVEEYPDMDASDVLKMHNGFATLAGNMAKLTQDPNAVGALTYEVYSGKAGMKEVLEAFGRGQFGKDDQGISTFRQLIAHIEGRKGADPVVNRQFSFQLGQLRRKYKATDALGRINSEVMELQVQATSRLNHLVYTLGMDPDEAYTRVIGIYDKLYQDLPNAMVGFGEATPPWLAARDVLDGILSPAQALASGLDDKALQEMRKTNVLTQEEFDFLVDALQ